MSPPLPFVMELEARKHACLRQVIPVIPPDNRHGETEKERIVGVREGGRGGRVEGREGATDR